VVIDDSALVDRRVIQPDASRLITTASLKYGLVGKMIIVRNITNEKMAEEARRDFIAHLSHEFKTPLTSIKSYSEMLLDGEVNEAETKKDFYNN